jgi:hypothetical protein
MKKILLLGGAVVALASVANAADYTLSLTDTSQTADVNGADAYSMPVTYTSGLKSLVEFCEDASHDVYLGATYTLSSFTLTAANSLATIGYALTPAEIGREGALVNYGEMLVKSGAADYDIAGVQDAIWTVGGNIVTPGNALQQLGMNTALAWSVGKSESVSSLYGPGAQLVSGAVPEPATWALMLIGFGVVGAAARHRARIAASAS